MEKISKNLKKRFILKYSALAFLGITMLNGIFLIISRIIEELSNKPGIYTSIFMGAMFFSLIVGMILAIVYQRIYDRNLLIKKLEKNHTAEDVNEFIEEYLSIFVKSKMGYIRYSEYIFWFSREICSIHLHNDFGEEYIHSLYHGLRCNDKGVNIAGLHKDSFISLCKNILGNPEIGNKNIYIYKSFCSMEKEKKQIGEWFVIALDQNKLYYYLIIIAHIAGCLFIGGRLWEIIGNLLLALPGDVLMILIYKGYVRERELKEEREMDKQNAV